MPVTISNDGQAYPAYAGDAFIGLNHRKIGVVAIVVAKAISTIIANSVGEMTPKSSPILSTINSISPRVFIKIPRDADVASRDR